jgi:hypothetical protein
MSLCELVLGKRNGTHDLLDMHVARARNTCFIVVGKTIERRPDGKLRRRFERSIKMYVR